MEFFNVASVMEVYSIIDELAKEYKIGIEEVSLMEAVDRITAKDYHAKVNLPEFNRSTVDGYAIISSDVLGACESMPSFLDSVSEINMGENTNVVLKRGQAVYVPTGGMVPKGADGMVMIEYVQKLDDKIILVHKAIAPGENMTMVGDDLQIGDLIVAKGKKITAYDIGLFASMGISKVEVFKKPRFAIISTGDEIIDIDEVQKLGQIREINGYALAALIKQLGGVVVSKVIVKDEFSLLQLAMAKAIEVADIVLISGGSSVGTRDFTKQVIESFNGGSVMVHGISIKPGKPTIMGMIQHKLVFGLPGHPSAALIVFQIFVKQYIQRILEIDTSTFTIQGVLDSNVHSSPGKETYQMVELIKEQKGFRVIPLYGKSGMMTLLAKASGYIRISDEKEGIQKGELVEVHLLEGVEA